MLSANSQAHFLCLGTRLVWVSTRRSLDIRLDTPTQVLWVSDCNQMLLVLLQVH